MLLINKWSSLGTKTKCQWTKIFMLLFVKGKCLFDLHVNTVWQHTIKEPNVIIQDNFDNFRREHITV